MSEVSWRVRVKVYMAEANITQAELAKELGITQGAVSNILNGISDPKLGTFSAMCQALSLSADWLLFGEIKIKSNAGLSNKAMKIAASWQKLPLNYRRDIERAIEVLSIER